MTGPKIKRYSAGTRRHGTVVVVIPAYNEAHTIAAIADRATAQLGSDIGQVIVVDDGSTDGTADVLSNHLVEVLRHRSNRGKGASLMTGFRAAIESGASAVVTLDGDGQHRPEDIPRLIEKSKVFPRSIIIGSRLGDRATIPKARYHANTIANFWISWASGYWIEDSQSGFRLYPQEVLKAVGERQASDGFALESEILIDAARAGFRSIPIDIPAIYFGGAKRASHFRPVADISKIVIMVAWKLISRGMNPLGLSRMLAEKRNS